MLIAPKIFFYILGGRDVPPSPTPMSTKVFLPREATRSAVLPRQVVRLSVRPSVRL